MSDGSKLTGALVALLLLPGVPVALAQSDDWRKQLEPKTPACRLLSPADIQKATGNPGYTSASDGVDVGEGPGGGSSCQYDGEKLYDPATPLLGVVLIPKEKRYVELQRGGKPSPGCKREEVPGVGELAIFQTCPKGSVLLFVSGKGADFLIELQNRKGADPATLKPQMIGVARAAVAKVANASDLSSSPSSQSP